MKRRMFKLLLCLLLLLGGGAIINVAVAWGCALTLNPSWPHRKLETWWFYWQADDTRWNVRFYSKTGATEIYSVRLPATYIVRQTFTDQEMLMKFEKLEIEIPSDHALKLGEIPSWSRFRASRITKPNSPKNSLARVCVWLADYCDEVSKRDCAAMVIARVPVAPN